MLLARIYEVFPLICTHCGGEVKHIVFVTEATPIRRILEYIGEPATPPPTASARAPPIEAAELDQSIPATWLEAPPDAAFAFEQTVCW